MSLQAGNDSGNKNNYNGNYENDNLNSNNDDNMNGNNGDNDDDDEEGLEYVDEPHAGGHFQAPDGICPFLESA